MSLWDDIKERFAVNKLLGLSRDALKLSNNMLGGSEEGFFSKLGNGIKNGVGKIKGFIFKRFRKPIKVRRPIKIGGELLKKIKAGKKLTKKADALVSESEQFRQEVRDRGAKVRAEVRASQRQERANARDARVSGMVKRREERKKGPAAGAPVSKLQATTSMALNNASKLRKMSKTPGINPKDAQKLSEIAAASENAAGKLAEAQKQIKIARVKRVQGMQKLLAKKQLMMKKPTARPGKGVGQDQGPTIG